METVFAFWGQFKKQSKKRTGEVDISNDHTIFSVLLLAILNFNLLSVGQLYDIGYQSLFTKKIVVSKVNDHQVTFKGFRYNNL